MITLRAINNSRVESWNRKECVLNDKGLECISYEWRV